MSKRTQKPASPDKLKLLITVVNRVKSEYYADFLRHYGANMQLFVAAEGTAKTEMLDFLGLSDDRKSVIISVIRASKADATLKELQNKFDTVKNGKGIAFTVPMSSVIGVMAYRFLADQRDDGRLLK
ncbi:MAG: hypothetical protein II808_00855 [Clostridia bacterium]|nr:hypothetical protein [Clostridia bacterium]